VLNKNTERPETTRNHLKPPIFRLIKLTREITIKNIKYNDFGSIWSKNSNLSNFNDIPHTDYNSIVLILIMSSEFVFSLLNLNLGGFRWYQVVKKINENMKTTLIIMS